ncbi:hypothetical protein IAT40_002661 [Kwoniella sp. CBS 6097]
MSLLLRRNKTDREVRGNGDDHSLHRSYSLNRGLAFMNNQIRTVQRGLEVNFGKTSIGALVNQADGLQHRQYEVRCQLKIDRIERNIQILEGFEIVTNLASSIVGAVQLLAPAGPVIYSINQLLGYAKSVQVNKREALSVTDKAVSMTLGMQQTIKHVKYQIPQVMIVCIHDFYRALDECATDVCTAAEHSTLPKELLAQVHGDSFKAILEEGREAMEEAYKMFIANCQVIAIAGIYHPNNPNVIAEDQQDRKADEEFMCQDLRRLLALGVDPFLDALQTAGLTPIQREGIKRAIVIAWKLEAAKKQAGSTSASGSTPIATTAPAITTSNTISSLSTLVDPAAAQKSPVASASRPASPQTTVTVFMLLYMVNTPSVAEALSLPQTPIPDYTRSSSSSDTRQSGELVSLRSDFFKRALDTLEAIEADSSPPKPPRRAQMKVTSLEPKPFLAHIQSSAIPEWSVFDEEILFIRRVGDSSLGNTWKGHWSGKNVRIKSISRPPGDMNPERSILWRHTYMKQVEVWKSLKPSPFVLEFLGASCLEGSRPWHFLSPFCSNGDVDSYLASSPGQSADRLALVYQIALGLRHLHAQQIVHGNLRPRNVLINDKGQAVLSDFGFFFDMKVQMGYNFEESPKLLCFILGGIMPATFTPHLPFDLDYRLNRLRPPYNLGSYSAATLHEVLLRAYRNHPLKRPTMARLCNILEHQRFTSETQRPDFDRSSLAIGIWGYNLWIDAVKAGGKPSPFHPQPLGVPPPASEETVVGSADGAPDEGVEGIPQPRKAQGYCGLSSYEPGSLVSHATLGLYNRVLRVGWKATTEPDAVEICLKRAKRRLVDNVAILEAITFAPGADCVLDCDLVRDIAFAARVLTLRDSMQFGPGDTCPYDWTDDVRDVFRREVEMIAEETCSATEMLCRQLQRLVDDEQLLLTNYFVGYSPGYYPQMELSGDGVYGYPGRKGVLKPLLNRLVGFPWWSLEKLHQLAEYDSELDPGNALTEEAASLERTPEVIEIEDALEFARSRANHDDLRSLDEKVQKRIDTLINTIREIEGLQMSVHVDDRYAYTEVPPPVQNDPSNTSFPELATLAAMSLFPEPRQIRDTKGRAKGKRGMKGIASSPLPKLRYPSPGWRDIHEGGEKRRMSPKQKMAPSGTEEAYSNKSPSSEKSRDLARIRMTNLETGAGL